MHEVELGRGGNGLTVLLKQPIGIALLCSTVLHVAALLGVGFALPEPRRALNMSPPLEVVLVNSKSASRPIHADALAQNNLDGGGNTAADRRVKSPLPNVRDDQNMTAEQSAQHVRKLEQEVKRLLTQTTSTHSVKQDTAQQQHTPEIKRGRDLVQSSLEIIRLEAEIHKNIEAYQKMPRRKFIGARTQEYRFTRYIEDWRIKVERIGNLNYPEAARKKKIYGSVQITVSIRADGSLENIEVTRSSGQSILDAAAVRIVKLGAPYAPLSADIRKDYDILSITKTVTFTLNDKLESE